MGRTFPGFPGVPFGWRSHRHAAVRVDVNLANAELDASLNLFNRDPKGLLHLAAELIDDVLEFLWN